MNKYRIIKWLCGVGVLCAGAYAAFSPIYEFNPAPILRRDVLEPEEKTQDVDIVVDLEEEEQETIEEVEEDEQENEVEDVQEQELEIQEVKQESEEAAVIPEPTQPSFENIKLSSDPVEEPVVEENTVHEEPEKVLEQPKPTPKKKSKKKEKKVKIKRKSGERISVKEGDGYYKQGTIGKLWESSLLDTSDVKWWISNEKSFKKSLESDVQSADFKNLYNQLKNTQDDQLTGSSLMALCKKYYSFKDDAEKRHFERSDVWYYCLK